MFEVKIQEIGKTDLYQNPQNEKGRAREKTPLKFLARSDSWIVKYHDPSCVNSQSLDFLEEVFLSPVHAPRVRNLASPPNGPNFFFSQMSVCHVARASPCRNHKAPNSPQNYKKCH